MPQTPHTHQQHRATLQSIARWAMLERGLLPTFSAAASAELQGIQAPAVANGDARGGAGGVRDLTDLLWASIDNDDSRDLDQLTVAEMPGGHNVKILVAVADVDALVKTGCAIDEHARHNTTSVYTAALIFPMLPEKLSTNLTSLNVAEERLAVVVAMEIGTDGSVQSSDIYRACVRNHAKLAYDSVATWLAGRGAVPKEIAAVNGLAENLRVQDRVAQNLKNRRHAHGALSLETIQAKPIFDGDRLRDLAAEQTNRARQIIEDFMIAANKVERQVGKSAAVMLLEPRIGEHLAAIVTGASDKGTWARLPTIPVEGRVVRGFEGADVGDQIRVQVMSINVERGFIDLVRADHVGGIRHGRAITHEPA